MPRASSIRQRARQREGMPPRDPNDDDDDEDEFSIFKRDFARSDSLLSYSLKADLQCLSSLPPSLALATPGLRLLSDCSANISLMIGGEI